MTAFVTEFSFLLMAVICLTSLFRGVYATSSTTDLNEITGCFMKLVLATLIGPIPDQSWATSGIRIPSQEGTFKAHEG